MALTKIKTGGLADNSVTDAKVADAITVTGAQTGITQVGTLTAGTWNAGVIASAYLDADTAHLSTTQTFSGAKTFTGGLTIDPSGDNYVVMTSGATDANLGFLFKNSSDVQKGFILYDSDDNFLQLGSGNVQALKLDSSQNATFSGDVNVTADGARFFVSSADYELVSIGRAGSSGSALDQAYIRLKNAGTNTVAIHTAGDSYFNGGNVGINETSPSAKLHVALDDGTMPSVVASEAALVLQNNSATSDGCTFTIISGNANNSQICFGDEQDYDAGVILYNNSANALTFRTGGSGEDMRIDETGAVLFNTTTRTSTGNGGATFDPNSVGRAVLNLGSVNYTSEVDLVRLYNDNGEVGDIRTNGSGASFNSNSDYRLKENQVSLSNALTRLNNLKPYRFNFKADPNTTLDGFFAHEVQEVVPEAVTGTKDQMMPIQYQPGDDIPEGKQVYDVEEYSTTEIDAQKMDASKLVPLLVAAVQELSAKVEALENA